VTAGGLLHDIGKILHRAESSFNVSNRSHSILGADYLTPYLGDKNIIDCIKYHHRKEIDDSSLNSNSPAYIVYIANNISAGLDRVKLQDLSGDESDNEKPLESIYNLLNNNKGKTVYSLKNNNDFIKYPDTAEIKIRPDEYSKIASDFVADISNIYFKPDYINSLLELCETHWSYVPYSVNTKEVSDISLFDHSKITAALSACIYLYLNDNGISDYRMMLLNNESHLYDGKIFSLLSLDISGIQDFIYTISSKGALKGLRARSFYLELLLENIIDEILEICSLSRTNILYSGGGHAYILLPNTNQVHQNIKTALANINRQLMEKFGTKLFVCYGIEACSANELMSNTGDPESYSNIFRSVSRKISTMKLRRYSADDLRMLNAAPVDKEGRECAICGISGELLEYEENILCKTCSSILEISRSLIKNDTVFLVINEESDKPSLPIFSKNGEPLYMVPISVQTAKQILNKSREQVVRIYSKNAYRTELPFATKLWMGDYAIANINGEVKTFAELAECSAGVKKIGVLRADVDNLGMAFVNGFVRENDPDNKHKYVTISRTSTLSRSLSIFFKYYINVLLKNPQYSLTDKKGERNVVVVYSGGDDMFIVGAWDEVLSAALDIRRAFNRYTGGTLTMSAGFNIFDPKYPISRMAEETAQLEARAKDYQDQYGKKNAISLFGLEMENGYLTDKHTYSWDIFENKVLGEKYSTIKKLCDCGVDYGNTFLHNMLYLIRQAEKEKINIARLAYLLARHEPSNKAEDKLKTAYSNFSHKIYQWVLKSEDRRQLITALIIYIYTLRDA